MARERPWRVARFDITIDPAFDARIAAEPGIELVKSPIASSDAEVAQALAGADVYHVSSTRNEMAQYSFVTEGLLERNPHLLAISTYGAGHDSVDVDACTRAGVIVMNQAGANRHSVAEHALAMILSIVHRLVESDMRLRKDRTFTREDLMGREVRGLVLGLVGIGHVGTTVASLARAFGMDVIAFDPLVDAAGIERRGARPVTFEELLATSDIVSLHCPREEATLDMMGAAQFARMKRGAYFVSTARGGIHDEAALAAALASGHLAAAGLDVWQPEPPPLDHPLLQMPNVFATYHTAGVTREARGNIARLGSEQIVRLLRGEKPPRLVNAQAWPAFEARFGALS